MSALARFFLSRGKVVSGYDKTATPLTEKLQAEGASIVFEDAGEFIDKEVDLVVYTPAVRDGVILSWYREHGYNIMKRSEVLGVITASGFSICVAGTHGKTSISTMVAHILRHTGYGCNAFLGGISTNYQTNYWSSDRDVFVVEADEFDRSFLRLSPDIAIVSAIDPDHLDIYGTAAEFAKGFTSFVSLIDSKGLLICNHSAAMLKDDVQIPVTCYALHAAQNVQVHTQNLELSGRGFLFDIAGIDNMMQVQMQVGGLHNVENMLAAILVATYLGIDAAAIKDAVAAYEGVYRRFMYVSGGYADSDFTYIDDYAHHPTELQALLSSVRQRFADKAVTVIFQPHLFSRTKDFASGFADVLSQADNVWLLPVYPAREQPLPGVDSAMLAAMMPKEKVILADKDVIVDMLDQYRPEVLVTAGAGDIDQLTDKINEWWHKQESIVE